MAHHLVIQLARFGDMIQTKRLLLSLARPPGDTAHLAVDASLTPLARKVYPFAVVHAVPAHKGGGAPTDVLTSARDAFADLAAIPFESVYNLNFSGMALALAGLFDPDSVRGYSRRNGQVLRSRWLRMGFRWMDRRRSAPLNLVDFWAYLHPDPVAPGEMNPGVEWDAGRGKVAVVASGREARRSLPPDVLAPLIEAVFAAGKGPELLLLGGEAERAFGRRLARLLRPATARRMTDLCGRTGLADLPEILAGCGGVLTPDTGIMHLAAHCGVAVKAFFLSSAWCFETGPYGNGHTVYQATRDCAPCVETRPCPYDVACLPPFAAPELARAVAGELCSLPGGVAEFRSACDALGCDYVPVNGDPLEMGRRKELRGLLAEYTRTGGAEAGPDRNAGTLFHETDWILPPEGAGPGAAGYSGEE